MNKATCSISGCEEPLFARTLCKVHYNRAWFDGTHTSYPTKKWPTLTCSDPEGCDRRATSRGLCHMHYCRALRAERARPKPTTEERFWAHVDRGEPDECWEWTGETTFNRSRSHVYGVLTLVHSRSKRVRVRAHRLAYELLVGPIPEGLVIDHLCNNTRCVNPAHLEPKTNAENTRRGTVKTHCKRGHPLAEPNLIYDSQGGRKCKACAKIREDARTERRRQSRRRL